MNVSKNKSLQTEHGKPQGKKKSVATRADNDDDQMIVVSKKDWDALQKKARKNEQLANQEKKKRERAERENHEKDKRIDEVRSELNEWECKADDGETLKVVEAVSLSQAMEQCGVPADVRPSIHTFLSLQKYIAEAPDGKELYHSLPSGVKKAGGPAAFGLILYGKKRPRNLKMHSQLPADANASVMRIKDGVANDQEIDPATVRFILCLTPRVRQEIALKKAADLEAELDYDENKRSTGCRNRMKELEAKWKQETDRSLNAVRTELFPPTNDGGEQSMLSPGAQAFVPTTHAPGNVSYSSDPFNSPPYYSYASPWDTRFQTPAAQHPAWSHGTR